MPEAPDVGGHNYCSSFRFQHTSTFGEQCNRIMNMLDNMTQRDSIERFAGKFSILQSAHNHRNAELFLRHLCCCRVRLDAPHLPAGIAHQSKKTPVATAEVEELSPLSAI